LKGKHWTRECLKKVRSGRVGSWVREAGGDKNY
jgi:hypothetical protein